jgi:catechol 2,3-dioxygenase-like lactoylglutathione lyase family enzyme
MECCQLALSTMDLARTHWWYQRALGFVAAGERRYRDAPAFATVPDLPEAALDVWCLVGAQPFMQIEMIEFARPRMRPRRDGWQRSDIGYAAVGIHVHDFARAVQRIEQTSGEFLSDPIGPMGDRRVCLLDPDGTLLELIERHPAGVDDSRESAHRDGPAICSVSLVVRDLELATRFWVDVVGSAQMPADTVHRAEHESLWGLSGARRETRVVRSGTVLLELVQYLHPISRRRRAGQFLSDQGILNVAFGSTDRDDFEAAYANAVTQGFKGLAAPWTVPDVATVVYLADAQGFTVEFLHIHPNALTRMGFIPNEPAAVNDSDSHAAPQTDARLTSV